MITRRELVQLVSAALTPRLSTAREARGYVPAKRFVLVTIGGIRRQESFSEPGIVNIPHLYNDLLPQSIFYPYTANE